MTQFASSRTIPLKPSIWNGWVKWCVIILLCAFTFGCATPSIEPSSGVSSSSEDASAATTGADDNIPASVEDSDPKSGLSAELLYDVLLGSIANQRGEHKIALEAFSRAAYLSRDSRINADAIQLAMYVKDYQKAAELSRLMLQQDKDSFRVKLELAKAQIGLQQLTEAITTLVELARAQPIGQEAALQEIANTVARQETDTALILQQNFESRNLDEEPQITLTAALLASRLKQPDRFIQLVEASLESLPGWEVPAILKLNYLAENDPDEVVQWAENYLVAYPELERLRTQYARVLIDLEDLEASLHQLETVLQTSPNHPDALYISAVINMDLDQPKAAEELFRRYIEIGSNGDQARLYLADLLTSQKRYDEAAPLLRQVQSKGHYLDAQIAIGRIVAKQHGVDDGLRYLQRIDVYSDQDAVKVILQQELLLQDDGQIDRALGLLSDALKRWPDQPDLLYNRGLLAAQHNRIDIVEKDMHRLIALQPDNAHAYNTLGYTLADQTDRFDKALELIEKAHQLLPDDAFILDSMGWINYRLGNHALALEYLEWAISIRQDAEIAAHLGEVLWVMGEQGRAEEVWREGICWAPGNTTLLETMSRFLEDQQHALNTF